jgi:hypothetical protein
MKNNGLRLLVKFIVGCTTGYGLFQLATSIYNPVIVASANQLDFFYWPVLIVGAIIIYGFAWLIWFGLAVIVGNLGE